jgi:hypothetical protein
MATTVAAKKAKGRHLQNLVRDLILENFKDLEKDDVSGRSMGCAGTDILLSPKAKIRFPYSVECKNCETTSIWSWWEQTSKNILTGTNPLLIFKRNRSVPLVVITLEHFIHLTKENHELKETLKTTTVI